MYILANWYQAQSEWSLAQLSSSLFHYLSLGGLKQNLCPIEFIKIFQKLVPFKSYYKIYYTAICVLPGGFFELQRQLCDSEYGCAGGILDYLVKATDMFG